MKDIFFTWQGGEGGDFILSCLNYFVTKQLPIFDSNARCEQPPDILIDDRKFYKSHKLWLDHNFANSRLPNVVLITNPNQQYFYKKKIVKMFEFYDNFMTGISALDKKVSKFLKDKNFKQVYFYSYQSFLASHQTYIKKTMHTIKDLHYTEIKTEMKTFEDVKNTIEHILSFLNLDYTIDENLTQNIETFLYRQQSLIPSEHWPHLSY